MSTSATLLYGLWHFMPFLVENKQTSAEKETSTTALWSNYKSVETIPRVVQAGPQAAAQSRASPASDIVNCARHLTTSQATDEQKRETLPPTHDANTQLSQQSGCASEKLYMFVHGGQSTPMFSIKDSGHLVADCYKNFTVLYSNSSRMQWAVRRNYKTYFCQNI